MSNENDLSRIIKIVENHERRILKLEGLGKQPSQQRINKKKRATISDHLSRLKSEGFFDKPKFVFEIVTQLAADGFHYPAQSLTWALQRAVRLRELGRIKRDSLWAYCKR